MTDAPSPWLQRWAHLLPPHATVLDVACGAGRHVRWLAAAGHRVTAIDRETDLLAPLQGIAETLAADLEGAPWPLPGRLFDLVLVTHYLWRPLVPALRAAVAPGGLLVVETFGLGQAALGRPRRPEFLLRPGELLDWLRAPDDDTGPWQVVAFEQGRQPARGEAPARELQRVVARRGGPSASAPDLLLPEGGAGPPNG